MSSFSLFIVCSGEKLTDENEQLIAEPVTAGDVARIKQFVKNLIQTEPGTYVSNSPHLNSVPMIRSLDFLECFLVRSITVTKIL